ncbi:rRNA maturation RNase YbeY [Pelagibius litoralis]|uniref:Endoribonuclease YbeY n=1 Tax=Pelagibius litoralis TaxID=374515 RepID=A0A967F364_9PROT|nr:rRNA maturation RNase YbeY [Pelagibius litoralis]NIA72158.1 rRNA maturation RNase YbeY [Pelagibius litoralis]
MKDEPGISPLEVAVSLQDAAWGETLDNLEGLAERSIRVALSHVNETGSSGFVGDTGDQGERGGALEVSLLFADDAAVAALNQGYRGRSGPTNVLSFPNMDGNDPPPSEPLPSALPGDPAPRPRLLGDIVLARQTVLREAAEQDKTPQAHIMHLLIHGFLHLLGYDHENEAEAEEMEALEIAILADLDVADPYRRKASDGGAAAAASLSGPPLTEGRS